MNQFILKCEKWIFSIIGSILLFGFVHILQKVGGFVLPGWSVIALSVIWAVTLLSYMLQLNIFNRIGGTFVVLLSLVVVAGTLLPKQMIEVYPERASQKVTEDFDVAWKTVYGRDFFEEFSLHKHLLQYTESLAKFDVHRAGQIGLFALFGVALGICFLFPIDPADRSLFYGRLGLLIVSGIIWSLQMELLQVLSVSRDVTFVGFLESSIGSTLGVFVFAVLNILYITRKKLLKSRRFNILGVGIDAVNMSACLDLFDEIIEQGRQDDSEDNITLSSELQTRFPAMTTAMGVAGIVESRRNQMLQRILNESVLNTPDGMPLVWLGKLAGYRSIDRVYGPDLLRDACAHGVDKKWRHYFWGAAPGIVEKLKDVLEEKHPKIEISGICCPPFRPLTQEEEDQLVEEVNSSNTDIFWIGISTPKQLYFMDHIRDRLNCKIICPVGYAFDVNAGVEVDAPDWIKYSGFQWLHRAIKQPRLWKRYLPDNPTFIFKVLAQSIRLKQFPMFQHTIPHTSRVDEDGSPRFPIGVVELSAMTLRGARDRVAGWIEMGKKHYVNICTADTLVQCYDQPALADIVMKAGMATTDGMPLVWMAKRSGFKDATRVYGPDLMLELCALSEQQGYSHYFYGATDEVLAKLRKNLLKKYPKLTIAGMYSPPFRPLDDGEKEEVAARINAANPDIVWCGLGTPKQDYWVSEFRPKLNASALIAVGAAFNFHAGYVRQAPSWMMRSGFEWLFRLFMEPKRLWRRDIIGSPRFILLTFRQWIFKARA